MLTLWICGFTMLIRIISIPLCRVETSRTKRHVIGVMRAAFSNGVTAGNTTDERFGKLRFLPQLVILSHLFFSFVLGLGLWPGILY